MKHILFYLLIVLAFASCSCAPYPLSSYSSNPFLEKRKIGIYDESGMIRFSLLSDTHFGRDDGGVRWFNDNYYEFLSSHDYPFAISLGDISDSGRIGKDTLSFISEVRARVGYFIECIGNHDRHNLSPLWDSGDEIFTTAAAYSFATKDGRSLLSIYKLDSSERVIGDVQMRYLEEALASDDAVYRIIITHETVTSGGEADISAVLFGLNIQERNRLYRIMSDYDVGIILTGHYHKGNIEYHMKSTMGEFNASAFHQRHTKPFEYESEGYWYDVMIDEKTGEMLITPYLAESAEALRPFAFNLSKASF